MRAVVWHGTGDIRPETVPDPRSGVDDVIETSQSFDRRDEGRFETVVPTA